mmetsp:Transcript_2895/g.4678  ORF Transcript_2895/g.4678 Transcript_2895/m.4678 type:complete len:337 (+) Transcript_2895:105-1115(+)|eukprot:CAMPEP_0119004522 /NCGR_PEP_ID=MMETSP1176-20130426/1192_1 /TAXON_ID=265551 /ORGANISM="Synedropsis recta cf, Strain CCMP1620" /LENGTH=336 /DNA_ID=CAMNT_0006956235 /DNA_START=99 /DNA_END=1109 /DNA_ORIENTATION=-
MTSFLSSTTLLLLLTLHCGGSIAHEYRIASKVLQKGESWNKRLPRTTTITTVAMTEQHTAVDTSSAALVLLILRGGSDYYGNNNYKDDNPEEPYRNNKGGDDRGGDRYSADTERYYDDKRQGGSYYDDDNTNERDYDDRGGDYGKSDKKRSPNLPNLPNIIKNGDRRIGLALLGSGAVFTMLGVSLFFNKSLMRLGNLLFIAGVPLTIGPGRTAGYFFQPKKSRATACLALGILLVFLGSPVFGIVLEVFGLLNLFGNMFPMVAVVMKQMPVVGTLFKKSSPKKSRRDSYDDDDRYGGDGYGGDAPSDDDDRYYGRDQQGGGGGYGGSSDSNDRYY